MLCVIAKIDENARKKLAKIQELAELFGRTAKPLYGHITLVTYLCGNEKSLISECRNILRGQKAFPVYYDEIRVLAATSILVASPKKAGALKAVQSSLAANHTECLDEWTRESIWYPHTTLVYDPSSDLTALAKAMQAEFRPITASVSRIEFSRVTESGYEIVDRLILPAE